MTRRYFIVLLFVSLLSGCTPHPRATYRRLCDWVDDCCCCGSHITSVPMSPWNQHEASGIPYYLPKPLLVVAKNVRHIDESKIGLTNSAPIPNAFDNQAAYADIKANVTVPGKEGKAAVDAGDVKLPDKFDPNAPSLPGVREKMTPDDKRLADGVAPDSFFTYQIVFVPDLSQKYGLKIRGNAGEVRAAMNMVNGWMYTGMGPYYLKDSSTAQNIMAMGVSGMFAGRGASQVLHEVTDLVKASHGVPPANESGVGREADDVVERMERLIEAVSAQSRVPKTLCNYAEVYIYEPTLQQDGSMDWQLIAHHSYDRQYLEPNMTEAEIKQIQTFMKELMPTSTGPEPDRCEQEPNAPPMKEGDKVLSPIPGKQPEQTLPGPAPAAPAPAPTPASPFSAPPSAPAPTSSSTGNWKTVKPTAIEAEQIDPPPPAADPLPVPKQPVAPRGGPKLLMK